MSTMTAPKVNLTENALKVLKKRYLRRVGSEVVEGPEDMFRRVACSVAKADFNYGRLDHEVKEVKEEFYELISSLTFLPNSPTLMNAGRRLGQLSACFVLPVEDSMDSIFEAVKNAALIHKSGGGTGFSFSRLRPRGDTVGSTKGVSSGPVSFMTVFDAATETIKQGGTRRGANMGILRVDHPDIVAFITSKDQESRLNNFNISVALTEDFIHAVMDDKKYSLINPKTQEVVKSLKARDVFNLIVNHAWKNGEPGIIFLDRMNETNPTPHIGAIESTNPCGEQPLLPYESCNLGSLNFSKFVIDHSENRIAPERIDWTELKKAVHSAVHFLDNVIDVNKFPLPQIRQMTLANRKIGLGVMGWADMLIMLGIPYNSETALELGKEVMKFIHEEAQNASALLAEERGVFPNYAGSCYDGTIRLRNATVTTIAPTGTLSIIAGCSSGVEPLFAISFVRNVLDGTSLIEVNPLFEKAARERGFWSQELMEEIALRGSIQHFPEIPEDVKRVFVTAHDITPQDHINMQAAFQTYVDNAVSKTVNFPNSATPEDVEDVYLLAYKLRCKGVTVYRDGSREEQVLSTGKSKKVTKEEDAVIPMKQARIVPRERPEIVKGATYRMRTGCGNLYVTINRDEEDSIFEVFTQMGKAGGCAASQSEAIGRLISLAFRINMAPEEIIKQIKGIRCHSPSWDKGCKILSCSDALARALEKELARGVKTKNGNGNGNGTKLEKDIHGACPECGGAVEQEGGCSICRDCGYTRC
jgi:ribonucleoside-diphosphate reductase alpha chain